MQTQNNPPCVSAQCRNGKNDKIAPGILSHDHAEYVEVYREDVGASVISVHEKVEPDKPKVRRDRAATDRDSASGPDDKKKNAERAQAFRRLSSLKKIYATRSPALFRLRHRVTLLTIAGGLLAFIAGHEGRKFSPADLQRWARRHVREATPAEVAQASEAALKAPQVIPAPSAIGFALELSKEHWFRADRPWGVHPADLTEHEVKEVQGAAKRAHDRLSAAAKRAANGATPREQSKAAIARKLGISTPTLRKRMREAGFDNASEFSDFVERTYKKKHRSDENGKRLPTDARALKAAAGRSVRTNDTRASNVPVVACMGREVDGLRNMAPAIRAARAGAGHIAIGLRQLAARSFIGSIRASELTHLVPSIHRAIDHGSCREAMRSWVGHRFFLGNGDSAGTSPPEFERIRNFESYTLLC